LKNPLMQAT